MGQDILFEEVVEPKVVLIDAGYYIHKAIFAFRKMKTTPSTYIFLTMILGDLKKVGLEPEDTVIIAVDKGRSWRKDIDEEYKSTRKAKREAQDDIDWTAQFKAFDNLLENLESNTPWHVIGIWGLEADDIIAHAVRKYKDKLCTILSVDADFDQLFIYKNVRIYSPHAARKSYKKPPKNPYRILLGKVRKEASDDLVKEILNEADYEKRFKIVCLLELPKDVEDKIEEALAFLPEKNWDYDKLPHYKLKERFKGVYKKDKVIEFEKSMRVNVKKKKKK